MKKTIKIIKHIISGGQSGVDRSALDFSIQYNLPYSGYCPKNRWAEDGKIAPEYKLTETKESEPEFRTLQNIIHSDGSLVIYNIIDKGIQTTIRLAQQYSKPFFILKLNQEINIIEFRNWLKENKINRLNVAGPRESNDPGIYLKTFEILKQLLLE